MVYKLKKVERTNMFKINGKNDIYIYMWVFLRHINVYVIRYMKLYIIYNIRKYVMNTKSLTITFRRHFCEFHL